MKFLILLLTLSSICHARTWTDVQGRQIEADLIDANEARVILKKGGKEFTLPIEKLSDADRKHVLEWIENREDAPEASPAPAAGARFDGKDLVTGGHRNEFSYPYDADTLKTVSRKHKGADTGFKIGIAVPDGFDPSKPQRVFIAHCAINNDGERKSGNFGVFHLYAETCVRNGWACLVYDSDQGRPGHYLDLEQAFDKLLEQWPGLPTWDFAVGGFSGGAKGCLDPCAFLLDRKYRVRGAFMAGCNEDRSHIGRDAFRVSARAYKNVKVYMSTGKSDEISTPAMSEKVIDSLAANGMKQSRLELFDGGHTVHQPHFDESLKWFLAEE